MCSTVHIRRIEMKSFCNVIDLRNINIEIMCYINKIFQYKLILSIYNFLKNEII